MTRVRKTRAQPKSEPWEEPFRSHPLGQIRKHFLSVRVTEFHRREAQDGVGEVETLGDLLTEWWLHNEFFRLASYALYVMRATRPDNEALRDSEAICNLFVGACEKLKEASRSPGMPEFLNSLALLLLSPRQCSEMARAVPDTPESQAVRDDLMAAGKSASRLGKQYPGQAWEGSRILADIESRIRDLTRVADFIHRQHLTASRLTTAYSAPAILFVITQIASLAVCPKASSKLVASAIRSNFDESEAAWWTGDKSLRDSFKNQVTRLREELRAPEGLAPQWVELLRKEIRTHFSAGLDRLVQPGRAKERGLE